MSDNIAFNPSTFGAQEGILKLADKFLSPDKRSNLRSGLFGFITSSIAQESAESVYHRNILYKENFLNTANFPRSIYNYAKIYDYTINLANEAECRILIGMTLKDIRNVLKANSGTIKVPEGSVAQLGNFSFVASGGFDITIFEDDRVSIEYNTLTFSQPEDANLYIKSAIAAATDIFGDPTPTLFFELRFHQASIITKEIKITDVSSTTSTIYNFKIPDDTQLAKFNVYYKGPKDASYIKIPSYFNESKDPDDQYYSYFNYQGDGSLDIYFSPIPGVFRPAYNSNIKVELITTQGSIGNFKYNNTPSVNLKAPLNNIAIVSEMVTDPSGGKDRPSLKEIKKDIIKLLLTRDNIISEYDLQLYLHTFSDRTKVNDSFITTIKIRDDLQKRLFVSYLLASDSVGRVIPTNTAPVAFDLAELENRGWRLLPGTLVIYDRINEVYRLLDDNEYPDIMIHDPVSHIYSLPFLSVFKLSPIPRLIHYKMDISKSEQAEIMIGDIVSYESFTSATISVSRSSTFENEYKLDCTILSTLDAIKLKNSIKVRFLVKNKDEILFSVYGENITGTNVFRAKLYTEDLFDLNGELIISKGALNQYNDSPIYNIAIPENINIEVELYHNNGKGVGAWRSIIDNNNIYNLVRRFKAEDFYLYENLEDVVNSETFITEDGVVYNTALAMVGASYYLNNVLNLEITRIIDGYISSMRIIKNTLHNNTSIALRFYNSFGPSNNFTSDRTNLSLSLGIKLSLRAPETLKDEIRYKINDFVKKCNDNNPPRFSYSNLIKFLETEYPEILYFNFRGLNGIAAQNVESLKLPESEINNYKRVPEYLCMSIIKENNLDANPYVPDVSIEFI